MNNSENIKDNTSGSPEEKGDKSNRGLFFTTYKSPITVVVIILILGGLFAYTKLQTSLFPEITFPKIKIIADAGLQPVDKMMVTVTRPLETAIRQ